jgi:hypothetical protein
VISVSSTFKWLGDKVIDGVFGDIDMRLRQGGEAWLAESRALAPVKTGFLRAEEDYQVQDRTLRLILGADYDIFQERGTRFIRPHPHAIPALAAIGRIFGGSVEMHMNRPGGDLWHGVMVHQGMTTVPRGLTGKQVAHIRRHVAPTAARLHRKHGKRAKIVVRRFD